MHFNFCSSLVSRLLSEKVPVDKDAGILPYVGPKQARHQDGTGLLREMAAMYPVPMPVRLIRPEDCDWIARRHTSIQDSVNT
jgi:hypothetical protein